jgi:hypothetical protein
MDCQSDFVSGVIGTGIKEFVYMLTKMRVNAACSQTLMSRQKKKLTVSTEYNPRRPSVPMLTPKQ